MFEQKTFLMIPGPTPVPDSALRELAAHPMPHRSKEFSKIFLFCNEGLKKVAKTEKGVPFIYAASGTGVMEAALVNVLNPGDKVVSVINGVFSKRWADMAAKFGGNVVRIEIPMGQAVQAAKVAEVLKENPDTKLLLVTHSETSTGVKNPIEEIAKLTKDTEIIFAIDAITGLGAMPVYMDDWGIDIILSGSQKGFMIPPGLGFLWASPKAIEKSKKATLPRYYWDWGLALKALDDQTTAFTPNVSFICALGETLKLMLEEGMENVWKRHELAKTLTRRCVKAMGLKLLADDDCSSSAITAVFPPDGISVPDIRKRMKEDWKIIIANGQKELTDKIFRLGHLGFVFERDILMALSALAQSLQKLGYDPGNEWQNVFNKTLSELKNK